MCNGPPETRAALLARAKKDAEKWCVAAEAHVDVRGQPESDQLWLRQLTAATPLDESTARRFFYVFGLNRGRRWNYDDLAIQIDNWRSGEHTDIVSAVARLADQLSTCNRKEKPQREVSAASKIAFFSRPDRECYIWDSHARFAAWRREVVRVGDLFARNDLDDPFVLSDRAQDYAAFHATCASILRHEETQADFMSALAEFRAYLRVVGGGMAVLADRGDSSFVARRLLDKLLWWEGNYLTDRSRPLRLLANVR